MATRDSVEREVRALTRWHLRRGALWRPWIRLWGATLALAVVVWVVTTRILTGDAAATTWLLPLVIVLLAAADAALVPRRSRRMFESIVMAQSPPGTPVHASFDVARFEMGGPDATYTVSTDALTFGTWAEGCLVLDTRTEKFYVLPGELVDDEARSVVDTVLGDRQRRL